MAQGRQQVLIVAVGPMSWQARGLRNYWSPRASGRPSSTPVALPVSQEVAAPSAGFDVVVTVEDSGRHAGFGSALTQAMSDTGIVLPTAVLRKSRPSSCHRVAGRTSLADAGLTAEGHRRGGHGSVLPTGIKRPGQPPSTFFYQFCR